jgi:hypothetical protein
MQNVQPNPNKNQNSFSNQPSSNNNFVGGRSFYSNNQQPQNIRYKQATDPNTNQTNKNENIALIKSLFLKTFVSVIIVLILLTFINYYLITTYISSQIANLNNTTNETIVNDPLKSNANIEGDSFAEKSLTTFLNSPAISEVDYKVEATANFIQNFDDQNCKTPVIPPAKNGCGFVVLPYSLNIPQEGTYLKAIKLSGELNEGGKIILNIKDYESGQLSEEIATIEKKDLDRKINIPPFMKKTEGLYFRFWTPGGQGKITKIGVDYFSIEDFKKVRGIIKNFKEKDSSKINILEIYRDKDENGFFNPKKDTPWICNSSFPGASVEIDQDGVFKVLRDSSCYNGLEPNKFNGDNKEHSLPPGKWFLVINKQESYDFEIDENQKDDEFLELEI